MVLRDALRLPWFPWLCLGLLLYAICFWTNAAGLLPD